MNRYAEHYTIRLPRFEPPEERPFIQDLKGDANMSLWHVPSDQNENLRKPVLQFANYFRREMHFDFVQYSIEQLSPTDSAFLLGVNPDIDVHLGIGAVFFMWVEWDDAPPCYSLEWAWIHPFFRHRGLLAEVWPHFIQRYERFHVSHPRSAAMQSFLNKIGFVEAIHRRHRA